MLWNVNDKIIFRVNRIKTLVRILEAFVLQKKKMDKCLNNILRDGVLLRA